MRHVFEILRKIVCVLVVTFLFVQFFSVSPLISEENDNSGTNDTQITENIDNESNDTNAQDVAFENEDDNQDLDNNGEDINDEQSNQDENNDTQINENNDEQLDENNQDDDIPVDNDNNDQQEQIDNQENNNEDDYVIEITYPEFLQQEIIGDVIINVYAPEGVFPDNSHLYVEKVEQTKEISDVLDEVRDENKNVVESYTFDIKVLNEFDEEIQPSDGSKVKVSFSMQHVTNENLQTDVYHIEDVNPEELTVDNVQVLEVITEGDEAVVETESFSFYTVEFTYNNLQYVLEGDSTILLSDILNHLGLTGTVENVEVSNSELFNAYKNDEGVWLIEALQAFTSNEWMKVTIDGVEYEIVVTDEAKAISNFNEVDLSNYHIDKSKLYAGNATVSFDNNSTLTHNTSANRIETLPQNSNFVRPNPKVMGGVKIRYEEAIIDSKGTKYPLEFYFKNITIYPCDANYRDKAKIFYVIDMVDVPRISFGQPLGSGSGAGSTARTNAGMSLDLEINIIGGDSDATYLVSFNDFTSNIKKGDEEEQKTSTGRSTSWAGCNTNYPEMNSFNESIKVTSSVDVYYADDRAFDSTYMRAGWYVPGYAGANIYNQIGAGSEVLFRNEGPSATASFRTHIQSGESGEDTRDINFLTFDKHHNITIKSGPNGKYAIWKDGIIDGDSNKLLYEGTDERTYDVPNGKEVTIKFTPEPGYLLRSLTVNGGLANAVARDENGNVTTAANAAYYTYTSPANQTDNMTVYVEWNQPNIDCVDCKNFDACENCHLVIDGLNINNYEKEGVGAYRGKDANSALSVTNILGKEDSFAQPLPYGNVFIDTSKLDWESGNIANIVIDIPDDRFRIVGEAGRALESHPKYVVLESNDKTPQIAYYGPIHSYLMYGTEKQDTEPSDPNGIRYLGKDVDANGVATDVYPRDNIPASSDLVASGTYKIYQDVDNDEINETYSVNLVDGTMIIEPTYPNEYLYRITYKDAVVLKDGSRGNLVLTTTKVEIEGSYTSSKCVYVGLQKANEMTVNATFIDPETNDRFIPRREYVVGVNGSPTIAATSDAGRNTIGEKVTFEVKAERADGSPVEGIISYGVKDLDWQSFESAWGRQPTDSYTENGGTTTVNAIQDKWTGTHEFYEYGEALAINSGALSYALLPNYTHDVTPYNYNRGSLPINELLRLQRENGLFTNVSDESFENEVLYNAPMQVIQIANKDPNSDDYYTANGLKFAPTAALKFRGNDGYYITEHPNSFGTDPNFVKTTAVDKYSTMRSDEKTFDSGFAVLLDASGSSLTWSGSYIVSNAINTDLFDSSFVQFLTLSHGTGGGIYVEDYQLQSGCEPEYRENMVTMPTGSDVKVTIVPEDGYRVNKINIDDIKVIINYKENGEPESASFNYGNGVASPDPERFIEGVDPKTGQKIWQIAGLTVDTQYINPTDAKAYFNLTITANEDGIFDVDIFNRNYRDLDNDKKADTSKHNIHADFDTDYYFTKIWVDAGSHPEDIPTTLTLTASPYVIQHDKVTLNDGTKYDISSTRTMHLDALDSNGEKIKDPSGNSIKFDIKDSINDGALLLTISGNRQVYPVVTIDTNGDGDPDKRFAAIGDDCFTVVVDAQGNSVSIDETVHPKDANDNYTNPYKISRTESGYIASLPGYPQYGDATATTTQYLLHHVTEIEYINEADTTDIAKTTDNADYSSDGSGASDVIYVTISSRPQKPYSRIRLNGNDYVITGNFLHKVIKNGNRWEEANEAPIQIIHEFERYNDGTYINKKTFTLDTTDANQSKYIEQSYINNGQDLVWKVKYPAQGKDFDGDGIYEWPALSIETEHIYDDMHEINADHVERLYWFVNERLGSLTGKWALDGYTNDDTKIEHTYASNSEVPGYMSYRTHDGNIKYLTTYFYLLATENREEIQAELATMADLRMAFMTPISSETIKRSSYADTYGTKYYEEWGGLIVNSIHQTKLKVSKNWLGGTKEERVPFKLTIHREYEYSQISHSDAVTNGLKVVTLPKGSDFNQILTKLANNDADEVLRFRNGTEPLTVNKKAAIVLKDENNDGIVDNLNEIDARKLVRIPYNTFNRFNGNKEPENKEADVYLWFDDIDSGTIYMWSDADQIFMAEDARGMFKGFDNLQQISGVHILNTSQTKDMSEMFKANSSGMITNLYNLREWDTSKVETFESFLENQNSLTHIHGIIDFNLTNADNFAKFIGTPAAGADWKRDGSYGPFIWYPNVYIDQNGNVVTPDGDPLTLAHSQTGDHSARELYWDSQDLTKMGKWWNNGINTPTNFDDENQYTTWQWDIQQDNMAYSDANKWSYRLYEDKVKGFVNSDFATDLTNSKEFVYNEFSGVWEADLTNVKTTTINVQKKTVDDVSGEFKFRIKFDSLYEPDDKVEEPTSDTIVISKRFVDENGVYLDLSEDPDDYLYLGDEFKLTLKADGIGDDPNNYRETIATSTTFPEGWKKNSNGTWSYTFTDIDDEAFSSNYLVVEPAEVELRYQGSTETSKFKPYKNGNPTKQISKISSEDNYHKALLVNTSDVGAKSDIQRATTDDLKNSIDVRYVRQEGLKLVRYEVWDGQKYEIYDVLIGVDENYNVINNPDGSIKNFAVYYGGVENGDLVNGGDPSDPKYKDDTYYPYYVYTEDPAGSPSFENVIEYATYDETTDTTIFVSSRGMHTLNRNNHILKAVENVGQVNMLYEDVAADSNIIETKYIFTDAANSDIKYEYKGSTWKKYISGSEDDTFDGNVPNDAYANINVNRMVEVWGTTPPNIRNTRTVISDPDYQTSGKYIVTDPETGISEEYYIIERTGEVISATHTSVTESGSSSTTIENIISSINFDAENGTADFVTSDGKEYHFSGSNLTIVPNIWEFTLRNGEDFNIEDVPLGTIYEVWEYGLDGNWTLINREEKKLVFNPDGTISGETNVTASTAEDYEGGYDLSTIKRYSKKFIEDDNGNYYQLKDVSAAYTTSKPSGQSVYEFETYSNDISILSRYILKNNVFIKSNDEEINPAYYRRLYTTDDPDATATDATNAMNYVGYDGTNINSIPKYKLDFVESKNGTFYKKTNGDYENIMPIDQSRNTSTGNGGVTRYIGNSDVVRHIFTNEKDTFTLTIDKTVKGNQGSRDQYFKFEIRIENLDEKNKILNINDTESIITKSFSFVEDKNGSYYRYKDGRYTTNEPEDDGSNAEIYYGYDENDPTNLDNIKRYRAIKPNLATNFFNYIMQNENNRDDKNAQRLEPTGDFLTYKEVHNNNELDEKEYIFEVENTTYPNHPTKYIYDTDINKWFKYTWVYTEDKSGTYYRDIQDPNNPDDDTYTDIKPDKTNIKNYDGYVENNVIYLLTPYDASGNEYTSGDEYFKYIDGTNITYELFDIDHLFDYENAYDIALAMLKNYKPGYQNEEVTEIPDDAISYGINGRQIVAKDGKINNLVVYLKHGEKIIIEGLNKGATYEIKEVIDGLSDYKTEIADSQDKLIIESKETSGEFGVDVEVDNTNGKFYKLKGQDKYERENAYFADFKETSDLTTLPKYKLVYVERNAEAESAIYYIKDYAYTTEIPTVETKWHYDEYVENTENPNDLSSIQAYKVDFEVDPNGTFYKINTDSNKKEDQYKEESPQDRYESLTTKYTLNVTRRYTNIRDGIVPTKAFAGYFMPLIIMNLIALCYVLYERRRYRNRVPDE